jgi:diguanylate cyclase (GGDEF)-like protein
MTLARVLLVGTPAWCEAASRSLAGAGHELSSCHDAIDAAALALHSMPHALVTQSSLPRVSGLQLCRLVRAELPLGGVPVIVVSSNDETSVAFEARAAGADAHVQELSDLPAALRGVLARRRVVAPKSAVDRSTLEMRLPVVLDRALRDGEIAADVRALANVGGLQQLLDGLVELASRVLPYSWLSLVARGETDVFLLHAEDSDVGAEQEARAVLCVDDAMSCLASCPASPSTRSSDDTMREAFEVPIFFGDALVGQLAAAIPAAHNTDVKRTVGLIAYELGGPLKIISLLEQVQRQAATDLLTGLVNRRALLDLVTREQARAERSGLAASFLLVDIDHFKRVNDVHGHAAGDVVLRSVARMLHGATRATDLACRWGGEEFVVVLPETESAGALIVAERIRAHIAAEAHELPDGGALAVTVSIGVSTGAAPWKVDERLAAADAALYEAKRAGRNRVVAADGYPVAPDVTLRPDLKQAS